MHADCLVSLFVSLFGCLLHWYNLQSMCSLVASIPLRRIWLKSLRVLVLLSFQQKCSSGFSSEVLELLVVNSSISVQHCFKDILSGFIHFCHKLIDACVSSLLSVHSLYIFIIKSTSSNSPLWDTSSSVLDYNLHPSTDVNICFHWSTKTLLPPALRPLPKRMSCTLGNDQKTSSYAQFSGFSELFCLLCVRCQLHNLNYLSITFCKLPSCDTLKNLKFR